MAKKNSRGKIVRSLEEYLHSKAEQLTYHQKRYNKSYSDAKADMQLAKQIEEDKKRTSNFSLRTKILKNPWIGSSPHNKALKWLFQEVFKDPKTYKYNKLLLRQGGLFIFEYKNPKYKGTKQLPWFDMYPLVISLGPVVTSEGIRNIGFNLHLLPPKVRIVFLCIVFELYKRHYRYQIFNKQNKPVAVEYQRVVRRLWRYGAGFCIRMYIPRRMKQIAHFPYKDWHKAIFIPSRKYDSILASKLIKEWRMYIRKLGSSVTENIKWQAVI